MHSAATTSQLQPAEIAELQGFISTREAVIGYRPVSDEVWAELGHGPIGEMVTVQIRDADGVLIASAHVSSPSPNDGTGSAWTVETVVGADEPVLAAQLLTQALAATLSEVLEQGGTDLTWTVLGPTPIHDSVAATFGLTPERRLHQMRRFLPTGLAVDIVTRPFDAEQDLAEWVRVNGRAFAWNPEQGKWTDANVRARMDEPWFDADGFLIHERDGRMAGFCWTKIHLGSDPLLGEIYVVAVDPDFHGNGLGWALTLAGLDSLARRGVAVGMLFVDADNVAAVRLYDKLGFVVHRTDCLYHASLSALTPSTNGAPT